MLKFNKFFYLIRLKSKLLNFKYIIFTKQKLINTNFESMNINNKNFNSIFKYNKCNLVRNYYSLNLTNQKNINWLSLIKNILAISFNGFFLNNNYILYINNYQIFFTNNYKYMIEIIYKLNYIFVLLLYYIFIKLVLLLNILEK